MVEITDTWAEFPCLSTAQLAIPLGGSDDSFTGQLLYLIAKADPGNFARLKAAYPREVIAYQLWQLACEAYSTTPTVREMANLIREIDRTRMEIRVPPEMMTKIATMQKGAEVTHWLVCEFQEILIHLEGCTEAHSSELATSTIIATASLLSLYAYFSERL